ncbi:MAG: InlB B-repeat-containing protein [Clostridia bacterium]|nr:InlB B-repeat-containing protein [Clostridia bacterium]
MKNENIIKRTSATKVICICFALILFIGAGIACVRLFAVDTDATEMIYATAVNLISTDGTPTVLTSDADRTEATYTWVAETATLTLNGYSGRSITANGDINLHLVGNNTLTLDNEETQLTVYGINLETPNSTGTVYISADEGGTLNIKGDNLKTLFYGVLGYTTVKTGTVNIDVSSSSTGTLYAFGRSVNFDRNVSGKAEINVDITRTSSANKFIYGFYNGAYIYDRNDIEINVDLVGSENDTLYGFSDIYIENAAPRIVVDLDNNGGYYMLRRAVDNSQTMSLTDGAYLEFNGIVKKSGIEYGTNANTVTTTPADNNYFWKEYDNQPMYSGNYVLSNLDGTPCEKTVFEYSDTPATLKWVGGDDFNIPAGKVDDYVSMNLFAGIRGADKYYASLWKGTVIDGSLPEGIYLAYNGGLLNGQFKSPKAADNATIRMTYNNDTPYDTSDDKYVDITISYGEISDKDRFLTVGSAEPVEMKTNATGSGWSYDGSTKTLTLSGYNGGPISTDNELNIHLDGENTITLTDENNIGINSSYSSGRIDITAEDDGVLNIKTPNNYTKHFYGIYAAIYFHGGTLNMDLASDFTGDYSFAGIGLQGYLGFVEGETAPAVWNVKIRNNGDPAVIGATKVRLHGNYNGGINIYKRNNVTVNVDIKGGEYSEITALNSLSVVETNAKITAVADNNGGSYNCYAVNGIQSMILRDGGRLDLTGTVHTSSLPSGQSSHTVSSTPANNDYFWKDLNDHYYYEDLVLCDLSGDPLRHTVFEYSAEQAELKWVGDGLLSLNGGAVGNYIGINLWLGLRGSNNMNASGSDWRFEVIEGSFPAGLFAYSSYNGKADGHVTTPTLAGKVKIKATDLAGTSGDTSDDRSVIFEVPYGAFTTNNPVTGLEVDKNSIILDNYDSGEIKATVTPSDAAYPYVTGSITGGGVSMYVGEPVNGVSVINLQSNYAAGKYILTVKTAELGLTKTVTVYVREATPSATFDYYYERFASLNEGYKYRISGDGIETVEFVADGRYYDIPDEWMGKTVNIVLVNGTDENCNSLPQVVAIPARSAAPSGFEITGASDFAATDGEIKGVDTSMEYRKAGDANWTRIYFSAISSLPVGEYHVRYYSTNSRFASKYAVINVSYAELTFTDKDSFDIPAGEVGSTSKSDVSTGVSGGKKPYTYAISGPAWITIDENGEITAVRPSTAQAATTATVTVTDAEGTEKTVTINIGEVTEKPTYTLTFNANGGSGNMDPVSNIRDGYTLPSCGFTPSKGYYFVAWAIGSPDGERKKPSETINVTEDVRVFAVWEKCTVIDTIDLTGVTVPVAGAYPTYDGITLNTAGVSINVLQWSKASSSTAVSPSTAFIAGEEYYLNLKLKVEEGYMLAPHQNNPYSFSVSVTSNLPYTKVEITGTGYIHLHYVVPVPYDVSFDANGGGGEMAGLNDAVGTYVLPECGFTAPVGHEFKCWSVNGTEKAVGDEITLDSDVTVKPVWTVNKYTITFNTDGGNAIDPITLDYGAAVTAPADPAKVGHTFAGWDKAIPETMPAEDVTVTAKWTVNKYTITFNTDGGSTIDPITLDYGASITDPADPAKVGHTFAGWDKAIPATMPAEDVTITAKWTVNKYTITFNTDGGNAIDPITLDYGAAVTAPADPTKTGYTFAGWDKAIPETMPAEDVTITAKWEKVVIPPVTSEPDPGTTAPIPGTSEPDPGTTAPIPGTSEPTQSTTEPTPGTTTPTPGTTKPASDENGEPVEEFPTVPIVISVVSVVLVAGAATAVIFIKKKKGIE